MSTVCGFGSEATLDLGDSGSVDQGSGDSDRKAINREACIWIP